jgi:hypothetical protein
MFVEQTHDSGFIIVGVKDDISTTNSKVWLLKTDKNGDTTWTKSIVAGMGENYAYCVQQTTDGGYVLCGFTSAKGAGGNDVFLAKTNSIGDTLWTKIIGGAGGAIGYSLQQTSDGGYIITGTNQDSASLTEADLYLIKTNSIGDTLWTKTMRGNKNQTVGYSVQSPKTNAEKS